MTLRQRLAALLLAAAFVLLATAIEYGLSTPAPSQPLADNGTIIVET